MSATSSIEWTDKTKWCTACKAVHSISEFGQDRSRRDGLSARCIRSRRVLVRMRPGYRKGTYRHGWLKPSRPGDKRQARRRINYLVERGELAHPNGVQCVDCGHIHRNMPNDRRHEYDHYLGYSAEHQLDIQVVCSKCHHKREDERRVR